MAVGADQPHACFVTLQSRDQTISVAIRIPAAGQRLDATLRLPLDAYGLVVFADGSGPGRVPAASRALAQALIQAHLATLRVDLLTRDEERSDRATDHLRFDIGLLADRIAATLDWASHEAATQHLRLGCFGAGTGGAAALVAAARRSTLVDAVVSRGGRPDLAGSALSGVLAPTLLLVGDRDALVADLNRKALPQLRACAKVVHVVPGASHFFEEPGAHEDVARVARAWFDRYLAPS